jgi:hypothetical protein
MREVRGIHRALRGRGVSPGCRGVVCQINLSPPGELRSTPIGAANRLC